MIFVQTLRTILFYLLFIGQTAVIAIALGIVGLVAGRTSFSWAMAQYWCWSNLQLLRIVAGLRTDVQGQENIPAGGCIIASKHQSDWDVFSIFPHTGRPAYIVKKELMRIPFFGWAARSLDCIEVDRRKGAEAIPEMMRQARSALDRGCRLVIFPEGTRKAPLAPPDYKQGLVRMYVELGVPVVPVALNAGLFWGRNSLNIWPGTARAASTLRSIRSIRTSTVRSRAAASSPMSSRGSKRRSPRDCAFASTRSHCGAWSRTSSSHCCDTRMVAAWRWR